MSVFPVAANAVATLVKDGRLKVTKAVLPEIVSPLDDTVAKRGRFKLVSETFVLMLELVNADLMSVRLGALIDVNAGQDVIVN